MKKHGIGFVGMLFVATTVLVSSFAFADGHVTTVQSSGSLYDNGFMNEVLTHRNPTPWNVVRHYVGNKPALIVKILKEQNISLDPSVKYPVGMAVTVPQKYVLKELLPTPSQAEVVIAQAEHQAELQKQANEFSALLKSKDSFIVASYGFLVLLLIALFAAVVAARSWHTKFVGAEATANARGKEFEKDKDYQRQLKSLASSLEKEVSQLRNESTEKSANIVKLLAQTPGQQLVLRDHSGKEHKGLISWTGWDEKTKKIDVWIQCPYCDLDAKNILGHISGSHPEQMNPDPKSRYADHNL